MYLYMYLPVQLATTCLQLWRYKMMWQNFETCLKILQHSWHQMMLYGKRCKWFLHDMGSMWLGKSLEWVNKINAVQIKSTLNQVELKSEDITCLCVDTNVIFECSTWYLTRERSEWVRYWVEHEKIKFVSTSGHVISCLLYRHRWNTRITISWTNPLFAESIQ